ncbi:MAG: cadherin repeat domain-containing protein, partial [Acidobacteriota bacterium]
MSARALRGAHRRLAAILLLAAVPAWASTPGDLDGDTDVDVDDIAIILADVDSPASGAGDPKDLDGDGLITSLDAGKAAILCTRALCIVGNNPPSIISSATPSASENQTAVIDLEATDPEGDTEGAGLSYGITGGVDQAFFTLDADTGVLEFLAAPDFEAPADADSDNVYEVQATVTDSGGLAGVQDLQVTVTDVDENTLPVGVPDSFDTIGNTLLLVDSVTTGGAEVRTTTGSAGGVLDNDSDPDSDPLSVAGVRDGAGDCADVTAPFTDCPTANGGRVTMESGGRFSYVPAAGDTAASDGFEYRLSDGTATVLVPVTITRR